MKAVAIIIACIMLVGYWTIFPKEMIFLFEISDNLLIFTP